PVSNSSQLRPLLLPASKRVRYSLLVDSSGRLRPNCPRPPTVWPPQPNGLAFPEVQARGVRRPPHVPVFCKYPRLRRYGPVFQAGILAGQAFRSVATATGLVASLP